MTNITKKILRRLQVRFSEALTQVVGEKGLLWGSNALFEITQEIEPVVEAIVEESLLEFARRVRIDSITELKPLTGYAKYDSTQAAFQLIDQFNARIDTALSQKDGHSD